MLTVVLAHPRFRIHMIEPESASIDGVRHQLVQRSDGPQSLLCCFLRGFDRIDFLRLSLGSVFRAKVLERFAEHSRAIPSFRAEPSQAGEPMTKRPLFVMELNHVTTYTDWDCSARFSDTLCAKRSRP